MHRYYDLKQLQLLFERLKVTVDQNEIDTLEASIWQVWIDARSETINKKMFEGADFLWHSQERLLFIENCVMIKVLY